MPLRPYGKMIKKPLIGHFRAWELHLNQLYLLTSLKAINLLIQEQLYLVAF
jgi:hypothetical protein